MTAAPPDSPSWRQIHQSLLAELDALAASTEWIPDAAASGVESLLDDTLRQVCQALGAQPDVYLAALNREGSVRVELHARVTRLRNHPELRRMREELQRRENEQRLYLLRFLLSGVEPPAWVWESMEEGEADKMRVASARQERDSTLLPRVESALAKVATGTYGLCEDCGQSILPERLQLVPWAECCTSCQCIREGVPARDAATDRRVPVMRF